MKDTRDDEIEIDLLQLFWVMKRRLWIMILAVVVGAAAAMLTPQPWWNLFTLLPP